MKYVHLTICLAGILGLLVLASCSSRGSEERTAPGFASSPDKRVVNPVQFEAMNGEDKEALARVHELLDAYYASGGVEVGRAGFHQFPGDSFGCLTAVPILFWRYDDGRPNTSRLSTRIDIAQEDFLTRGVTEVEIVESGKESKTYDVHVTFNAAVDPYAREIQARSDHLNQQGQVPWNRGVGLVADNVLYRWFTYGEIAQASADGQPVTVALQVPQAVADKISAAIKKVAILPASPTPTPLAQRRGRVGGRA